MESQKRETWWWWELSQQLNLLPTKPRALLVQQGSLQPLCIIPIPLPCSNWTFLSLENLWPEDSAKSQSHHSLIPFSGLWPWSCGIILETLGKKIRKEILGRNFKKQRKKKSKDSELLRHFLSVTFPHLTNTKAAWRPMVYLPSTIFQ